jgi:hypothetical protein
MPRRRHPIKTPFKRAVGRSKARVLNKTSDRGARRVVQTARKVRKVKRRLKRLF